MAEGVREFVEHLGRGLYGWATVGPSLGQKNAHQPESEKVVGQVVWNHVNESGIISGQRGLNRVLGKIGREAGLRGWTGALCSIFKKREHNSVTLFDIGGHFSLIWCKMNGKFFLL